MKKVYRVDSKDESKVKGGWFLIGDIDRIREIYPMDVFSSMTIVEIGMGICVDCDDRDLCDDRAIEDIGL